MIFIPRKPRVWYPGATYHIMSRGNHRQNIFKCDEDYSMFLQIIKKTQLKFPFILHSFCLMTNHIHLQIETLQISISKIISIILKSYSDYYNSKYESIGHLFQGRFKSLLIEDDSYFLQTNKYIHLNPFKAKMVSTPSEYKYSSYPLYIYPNSKNEVVNTTFTLTYFKGDISKYKYFIENKTDDFVMEESIRNHLREDDLWLPL